MTPNTPNESTFQKSVINYFQHNLHYEYKKNVDLFDKDLRQNKKEFLLIPILKTALTKINENKSQHQIDEAVFAIEKITDPDLVLANKAFYNLAKEGIDTYNQKNESHEKIVLFDIENPHNNHFLIVDEFYLSGTKDKRPDLVVFINGIPVSVIEFKNPHNEHTPIDKAYNQIKTYQQDIKSLFITNYFNSISNNFNNGVGTITSPLERYNEFKDEQGNHSWKNHFCGLYAKEHIIKILFDYVFFTKKNEKILASYHQFFAVEKIIEKSLSLHQNKKNQVGVVWHTTGAGKSYTMVFYTKQLLEKIKPLVIVITDRIGLDGQLFTTFTNALEFLRVNQSIKQITSRDNLIETLRKNTKSEIIFTTIQKFSKDKNNNRLTFDELSKRDDIFIIVDEAHRSHYDLKEGLARHIRDALPNAKFLGFSGTPIELEERDTKLIFGDYIDKYVMSRAVKDKTTVPIHYEPRLAKIGLRKDKIQYIDDAVDAILNEANSEDEKSKKFLKMEDIIGNEERLELVANDFIEHYEKRFEHVFGKVLFACISRKVAVRFYKIMKLHKPKWFSDDDTKGKVKLVMSGSSSDEIDFQKHIRDKQSLEKIEHRFKDEEDMLQIVIVANMWLTGFDVPCLNTLYIDKPIKDHNLIQAISRVNRVYPNKESGLIVDYIGIGNFLKKALFRFSSEDKKEVEIDFNEVIKRLLEYYELTKSYFNRFDYSAYLTTEDKQKRNDIIKDGINTIVRKEIYKKDFLLNSTKLLKTYSLCPLSDEAKSMVDEINYFKLVKNGILQIQHTTTSKAHTLNIEQKLNEVVSSSIETIGIVNIYDLLGIQQPEISILNEEFFNEIRKLKQKNIAYEILKKVLTDKIKIISRGNAALEKKYSERLQELINKYQNKTIESAKIIEEMILLSKEIDADRESKKKLRLSEDEIHFYYAVAQINDTKEIMKTEVLKDLAKELVKQIRENKTIDWHKRKNTQAKMRRMIKRLLKHYNYPPEGMEYARDLVLQQAEIFCENIA